MYHKTCSLGTLGTATPSIDPQHGGKQNKLNYVDNKESSLSNALPDGGYQIGIDCLDSASRNLFCCQNICFPLLDLHPQSLEEVLPLSVGQKAIVVSI